MQNKLFLLLASLFFSPVVFSQPSVQWSKCFGGISDEWTQCASPTSDGGYIIGGSSTLVDGDVTANNGWIDFWIVKMDGNGNLQWQKSLGGSDGEWVTTIKQASDGGYIAAGLSYSNDGDVTGHHDSTTNHDYWVVKLNSSGNLQWQKSLGGSGNDWPYSVEQTADGGFIVAGYSDSNDGDVTGNHGVGDSWIVKLDGNGNIQWQKCLGGTDYDDAFYIKQTADGGYIMAGSTGSTDGDVTAVNHGSSDYWLVKLNSAGIIQWQKTYGGTLWEGIYSLAQTSDGGYLLTGNSESSDGDVTVNHGSVDYWIVKTDSSGNMQWQKALGGSDYEEAWGGMQTTDGGYIVAGYSYSIDGDVTVNTSMGNGWENGWMVKLDNSGSLQWSKVFGGTNEDYAYSVFQTPDNGYIVAGTTSSFEGDVMGYYGGFDMWVIKFNAYVGMDETVDISGSISVFPNPFTDVFNIQINSGIDNANVRITDVCGKTIYHEPITGNQKQIPFNFPKGIYLLEIQGKEKTIRTKLVKD